ncbi:hypothetical protein HKX68_05935 [Dickeya dadantii]|uniref:hypothetical protein n=1 Tax=Dickeya dadantii TaxID=204038 RepID=UPI0013731BED|nr:hypothetical protein [Dickeya dadantii]NPE62551.1 hypothetical protein [Dickeya dadantii]
MKILYSLAALTICVFVTGCKSLNYKVNSAKDPSVYQEPIGVDKISRIRFVSNVTGTSIIQKSDVNMRRKYLVPHTFLGFYNETRDIGMPKISYRPQDYKNYYFEVKVKPEPTYIYIYTDNGINGVCTTGFIINPEAGKDYDVNYDPNQNSKVCVFHFNEIVSESSSGVTILKPAPFKVYLGKNENYFN